MTGQKVYELLFIIIIQEFCMNFNLSLFMSCLHCHLLVHIFYIINLFTVYSSGFLMFNNLGYYSLQDHLYKFVIAINENQLLYDENQLLYGSFCKLMHVHDFNLLKQIDVF